MKVGVALAAILILFPGCQGEMGPSPTGGPQQGWVSSGGEIFEDSNNPWFLKRQGTVRYCIQHSVDEISASREETRKLIHEAIEYWQYEFAEYQMDKEAIEKAKGIQLKFENLIAIPGIDFFEEIECTGQEDLKFSLGQNALSEEQGAFLKSRPKHVSLAVRTHYDRKILRGRGFIYVAPDIGPHAYPKGAAFIERPWSYSPLLLRILVHELGHVLGLPHHGNGLMAHDFPEGILRTQSYERYLSAKRPQSVLRFPISFFNCTVLAEARSWFGMTEEGSCLEFVLKFGKAEKAEAVFDFFEVIGENKKKLGYARLPSKVENIHVGINRLGMFYLPPGQEVFPVNENAITPMTSVSFNVDIGMEYLPEATPAEPRPVYFLLEPNSYEVITPTSTGMKSIIHYRTGCLSVGIAHVCY